MLKESYIMPQYNVKQAHCARKKNYSYAYQKKILVETFKTICCLYKFMIK